MSKRPPVVLALIGRHMHGSTQLPVRVSLLMLAGLFVLAEEFGFESIFGAFAAGLIVGQAARGADGKELRVKLDAVCFGWFYPFFFVGTGIKFDMAAVVRDVPTMLMLPAFALLFLVIRGLPVLLYRKDISRRQQLPFALSSAVPSLSIVVVITEIGVRMKTMNQDVATALVGAALLSVLLFPTIAGACCSARVRTIQRSCEDRVTVGRTRDNPIAGLYAAQRGLPDRCRAVRNYRLCRLSVRQEGFACSPPNG